MQQEIGSKSMVQTDCYSISSDVCDVGGPTVATEPNLDYGYLHSIHGSAVRAHTRLGEGGSFPSVAKLWPLLGVGE